jgi:RNA polymerase sigma-70 factor (ECF subfamily)
VSDPAERATTDLREPNRAGIRSLALMGRVPLVLGDEAAVAAAYRAHGGELYRAALRSLGDAPLAEEAVQETFVRAWRAADRFDPLVASLRTWLFAILRNVVVDMARARAVRPMLAADATRAPEVADGVDEFDRALAAWQVEEALRNVTPEHRVALVEVHVRGRPYGEVAVELGVPVGTVKSRVYYGLKALRLALEELGWVDGD